MTTTVAFNADSWCCCHATLLLSCTQLALIREQSRSEKEKLIQKNQFYQMFQYTGRLCRRTNHMFQYTVVGLSPTAAVGISSGVAATITVAALLIFKCEFECGV